MANHPVTCICETCRHDGTGDFAMREAFAVLHTDHDGRAFDLYRWIVDVRLRADDRPRATVAAANRRAA